MEAICADYAISVGNGVSSALTISHSTSIKWAVEMKPDVYRVSFKGMDDGFAEIIASHCESL